VRLWGSPAGGALTLALSPLAASTLAHAGGAVKAVGDDDVYAVVVPITGVQSEQLRLLQAHGLLTTPRMSHILDYDAESLRWVGDNWQVSSTPEANAQVRQVAGEAHALVVGNRLLDPGV
jgi:hypothetical protein